MTHPTDALPEYVAGTAAPHLAVEVAAHLRGCAECRAEAASWHDLATDVRAAAAAPPPDPSVFVAIKGRLAGPLDVAWADGSMTVAPPPAAAAPPAAADRVHAARHRDHAADPAGRDHLAPDVVRRDGLDAGTAGHDHPGAGTIGHHPCVADSTGRTTGHEHIAPEVVRHGGLDAGTAGHDHRGAAKPGQEHLAPQVVRRDGIDADVAGHGHVAADTVGHDRPAVDLVRHDGLDAATAGRDHVGDGSLGRDHVGGGRVAAERFGGPVATPVYAAARASRPVAALRIASGLLLRQGRLVRWPVWVVALAAVFGGAVLAGLAPFGRSSEVFALVMPLVVALAVAAACGESDGRADELVRSTPTSTRVVLLARLTLVLAVTVSAGIAASALLAWPRGDVAMPGVVLAWFGPLVPLSAASFAFSVLWRSAAGAGVALAFWVIRLLGPTAVLDHAVASAADAVWSPGAALYLAAGALALATVVLAPGAGRRRLHAATR